LSENERKAEDFFVELKRYQIAETVEFCIDNKKDYVIINAPLSVLDTASFRDFQSWAREQGLEARIAGIDTEKFLEKKDDCVALSLTPSA